MKNFLLLFLLSSMIVLPGCGGDGDSVEIGAPTYTSPKAPPLTADEDEDDDQIVINPLELQKNDPCFKYVRHEVVVPVASCSEVENGRVKESYKNTVLDGKLCLLRKSFPNGINIFTLIGNIQERKPGEPSRMKRIDVFGQTKVEDELVRFEMKADENSVIKYNLTQDTVTVRQVSKVWKKKRRYFRLACRALGKIVD